MNSAFFASQHSAGHCPSLTADAPALCNLKLCCYHHQDEIEGQPGAENDKKEEKRPDPKASGVLQSVEDGRPALQGYNLKGGGSRLKDVVKPDRAMPGRYTHVHTLNTDVVAVRRVVVFDLAVSQTWGGGAEKRQWLMRAGGDGFTNKRHKDPWPNGDIAKVVRSAGAGLAQCIP